MATLMTSDIARMLEVGQKEVFMANLDAYPIEYPSFTTRKTSNKETETYDSIGNLPKGGLKTETDGINYGKVRQAYQTSVTNKTWANGYSYSFEAPKYDQYGVVDGVKAKELARTMKELEEERAILRWDNAFATNLADGVPLCSNSKPLLDVVGTFNDTLATASSLSTPENHKTMIKMFADFKNQQGGKMKSYPTNGFTHIQNQLDIEEIYGSDNKANEQSNTKNVLPRIKWVYSTYLADTNAWFMWDSKFEHVIFQSFMDTQFNNDMDKVSTLNYYFNAVSIYETAALPNIGIVGNVGA